MELFKGKFAAADPAVPENAASASPQHKGAAAAQAGWGGWFAIHRSGSQMLISGAFCQQRIAD
jgi:hypothetical protein